MITDTQREALKALALAVEFYERQLIAALEREAAHQEFLGYVKEDRHVN